MLIRVLNSHTISKRLTQTRCQLGISDMLFFYWTKYLNIDNKIDKRSTYPVNIYDFSNRKFQKNYLVEMSWFTRLLRSTTLLLLLFITDVNYFVHLTSFFNSFTTVFRIKHVKHNIFSYVKTLPLQFVFKIKHD